MSDSRRYWNPDRELIDGDDLRDLQDEKIKHVVSRGYHNAPIIRSLWDDNDVTAGDVETIDELARAPLFRKDDSRELMKDTGEPFGGRRCLPWSELTDDGAYVGTSSGTTGTPTNIALTEDDLDVAAECQARTLWRWGLRPGDAFVSWMMPNHLASESWVRAARKIGAIVTKVDHDADQIRRFVHALEYLEPTVAIFISPPMVTALKDYFRENDLDPMSVWEPVESVGFAGEPLLEEVRTDLEAGWGIDLYEFSGGLEPFWQPGECRLKDRFLHVYDDHYYVEVVDVETGEPVEEGERGELVVTPLTFEALSHLRWAHDDVVEFERGVCDCGRRGTRIKFIGRVGDVVHVDGEEILPYDVLPVINRIDGMENNLFQFYESSSEALLLRCGYAAETVDDPDTLKRQIEEKLTERLSVQVRIVEMVTEASLLELGPPHKIPRVTADTP